MFLELRVFDDDGRSVTTTRVEGVGSEQTVAARQFMHSLGPVSGTELHIPILRQDIDRALAEDANAP